MTNRFRSVALFLAATSVASAAPALRVSGPFTHENLSIFLVHSSQPQASRPRLLTLKEAIETKRVTVFETGSVGELAIENQSSEEVYIQAGEIVKGGRQDRVLTTDLLLPPHSGKLPISSFCVEQGRWSQRGNEAAAHFNASSAMVPTKSLKMAVREQNAQSRVWDEVANTQGKLRASSGSATQASPTSMQLTLESKPVVDATAAYVRALAKVAEGKADVVGFLYAINGELNSGDVYGSTDLFRRMWPKLIEACATEAVAERGRAGKAPPAAAAVKQALTDAASGRESEKKNAGSLVVTRQESAKMLLFESRDRAGAPVHQSVVVK